MSVYKTCSDLIGLNADSQGQDGLLYLMLATLDKLETASPTGDTITYNPFAELLDVRLANWRGGHAYQWLAAKIGTRTLPHVAPYVQR